MAYGQVNIELITDKKEYYSKDLVQLTVVLEINGEDLEQESPIKLPDFSNFYERGTGSTKNSVVNPHNNTMASQLIYQMLLQPKQSGKIKIGSALVKVNGKTYKTEPFDIYVLEKPEKNTIKSIPNDIHLSMELESTEVYPHQPVIAVVKAYSNNIHSLRRIKNVQFSQQKDFKVYPLEINPSEMEMNRKNQVTQTLGVYMLFPEKSGRIEISPAIIGISSANPNKLEKLNSNSTYLNVRNLPAKNTSNFSNAVGDFHLDVKNIDENSPIEVNKPIDILVKLKGVGNISEKILPKIRKSADYELFPPKIKQKIKQTKQGLQGEIEAQYILIPKKQGEIQVLSTPFSFFNPETEQYQDIGEKPLLLKVVATSEQKQENKTALQKVNEYTTNVIENIPILEDNTEKEQENKINITTFLSDYALFGLAILGISVGAFIFLRKNKKSIKEPQKFKHKTENIKDIEEKLKLQYQQPHLDIEEMQNLLYQGKYKEYLQNLEDIFEFWDTQAKEENYPNFVKKLEAEYESKVVEMYQNWAIQVRAEKYAPCHTPEQMQELHEKLQTILGYIS